MNSLHFRDGVFGFLGSVAIITFWDGKSCWSLNEMTFSLVDTEGIRAASMLKVENIRLNLSIFYINEICLGKYVLSLFCK